MIFLLLKIRYGRIVPRPENHYHGVVINFAEMVSSFSLASGLVQFNTLLVVYEVLSYRSKVNTEIQRKSCGYEWSYEQHGPLNDGTWSAILKSKCTTVLSRLDL